MNTDGPHALYRFYDDQDYLLYVGITKCIKMRFKQHQEGQPWWDQAATIKIERFPDRQTALDAERNAVHVEQPVYNSVHADLHRIKSDSTISKEVRAKIAEQLLDLARERAASRRNGVPLPQQATWEDLVEAHYPTRARFR